MPGIIQKPKPKEPIEAPEKHEVRLRLDEDDAGKLAYLVRLADTDQNDVLRQLIRYAHKDETGA